MTNSNAVSLGCDVIAILSDHSFRAIGVIAQEMACDVPVAELQKQLDLMVANGAVKRHFVGDCWFYQLKRGKSK